MGIKTTSYLGQPLRYYHEKGHLRLNVVDLSKIFGVDTKTVSPSNLSYIPLGLTLAHAHQYNKGFEFWLSNNFDAQTNYTNESNIGVEDK